MLFNDRFHGSLIINCHVHIDSILIVSEIGNKSNFSIFRRDILAGNLSRHMLSMNHEEVETSVPV